MSEVRYRAVLTIIVLYIRNIYKLEQYVIAWEDVNKSKIKINLECNPGAH